MEVPAMSEDSTSVIIRKHATTIIVRNKKSRNFNQNNDFKGNKTLDPKSKSFSPLMSNFKSKANSKLVKKKTKSKKNKSI